MQGTYFTRSLSHSLLAPDRRPPFLLTKDRHEYINRLTSPVRQSYIAPCHWITLESEDTSRLKRERKSWLNVDALGAFHPRG